MSSACKPSTREKYIRIYETFESWTLSQREIPYAPSSTTMETYIRMRISESCGASIPTSICQALQHVAKTFGWDYLGETETLIEIMAKHADAHEKQTLKAAAYSPMICAGFEAMVCNTQLHYTRRFRAWIERLRTDGWRRWSDTQNTAT